MRFSVAVLLVALISGSLEPAISQARLAVPADPALEKQIRDSIEQARAEGNLSRVQRELSKLLEVYPNEPQVRAPIYLALAEASTGLGDDAKALQYRAIALAIDPHAAEWNGNQPTGGENRGQKADKILGFLTTGLQIATQIAQARQPGGAIAPQPVGQPQLQMNAFPQAPVGMPGAPATQMQPSAPGGFAGTPGMVVVGYDANNQPIYATAQQSAQQQMQPAQGMYPAPPAGATDPTQQMGQMQQPLPQPAYNAASQPAYPAPPQGQPQGYPPATNYSAQPQAFPQQQVYQQQQTQPAYPSQQPYQQQQAFPQQQAYPQPQQAFQQQQVAYPPQQAYPQQQQAVYAQQQAYPQQQPYPSQKGYPAQPNSPMQQSLYGGAGGLRAPANPYAPPANYGRRSARGDQAPPIKIFYDRSHAGDAAYFNDPCAALLSVDEEGALTVTPGCGEASLVIPAAEIVDLRMNVAIGKQIGAFHIATAKGLYLVCASDSGSTDESLDIVRSLKQQLKMTD
jgi:hypothetical protein